MKNLIAIPCFNESENIENCVLNLKKISKDINADICIFDDGSTDNTMSILQSFDDIYITSTKQNNGLSEVFNRVAYYSRVNDYSYTIIYDADNQYPSDEIKSMLEVSIDSGCDILLGVRDFNSNKIFTRNKNRLQKLGSLVVSSILGLRINDVTTGFRIYSSKAMENMFISNQFSYTIESLFFAKKMKLKIKEYKLNKFFKTRESRLFSGNLEYITKTSKILLSSIFLYRTKLFSYFYLLLLSPGLYLCSRFIKNYLNFGTYDGNVQSLIIGSLFIIISTLVFISLHLISYIKTNLLNVQKISYNPNLKLQKI